MMLMPEFPAVRRMRQEDHRFGASLLHNGTLFKEKNKKVKYKPCGKT